MSSADVRSPGKNSNTRSSPSAVFQEAIPPVVRIIDDDPEIRRSLGWLLEDASLGVQTYGSYQEFQERGDWRSPGCLLLDLRLADQDGLEVLEMLATNPDFHLPVIILTGCNAVPDAVKCMKLGAADFFEKPVDPDTLISRIRQAIASDTGRNQTGDLEMVDRANALSPAERHVVELMGTGLSSKQIARQLGLSTKTIVNRRASALQKTGANNASELVGIVATAELRAVARGFGKPEADC